MNPPVIAILEDDERRSLAMREQLASIAAGADINFFDNAPDMIEWLHGNLASVSLVCLDHDLGPNRERDGEAFDPGTGRDVVDYLCSCQPVCPVLIHSSNSPAAQGMQFALEDTGWQNDRVFPLGDLEWIPADWGPAVARKLGG